VRDIVGRVASLIWAFGPSAADHWRGYGYDPATRLADAWSWDGLAPGPDVSSLVNHAVGSGQVGTLAGSLAGVVQAPFARAADRGDLLSIGDAYDVTSPRGPGHRLTEVGNDGVAVTVDHDATGRVVEVDPGYTCEYDPDERLMAVRDSGTGDVVERYAYDADGRLAATYNGNGLTQRFAWDGAQMVAARNGNGVAKWDAVWGTLDQLLSWRDLAAHPVGDVAVLPITDHRGSIVGAVESDASGTTLLAGADYTPMGRVATLDPTDDDAETCREEGNPGTRCAHPGGMPFGFAGAWRSEATGLVYMRFRWYSPTLAQFLTPDPMGEVDSWNLYAYVGGDPINRWDPWGLDASSMANAANEGQAPQVSEDHGGEPPPTHGRGWSDAAQASYERSERLEGGRQPKAPLIGQMLGDFPEVTTQVAPVLWLTWVGAARVPGRGGATKPGVGQSGTVAELATPTTSGAAAGAIESGAGAGKGLVNGFNATESAIIHEARGIVGSPQFEAIRRAHAAGESVTVDIGGRIIQYEPGLPASGMTMFGENGFLIGREAFSSSAELGQTVLHELHRLTTSASSQGVSAALAAQETQAAASFAARALSALGP
jgi:RHS repeat-associated protein